MTYPHIRPEISARIKSIVVEEGFGIDDLPDDLGKTAGYSFPSYVISPTGNGLRTPISRAITLIMSIRSQRS